MSEKTTCVFTGAGEFEAQQVKAFLEAHGIPAIIEGEALRNIHGLTLDGLGEARVMVPTSRADEARELLRHVERGDLSLDDTEPRDDDDNVLPFRARRK